MNNDITKKAIAANIEALADILKSAYETAAHADTAMRMGEQNQAIGTMLDLDRQIEDALALHRASIALHRAGGRQ